MQKGHIQSKIIYLSIGYFHIFVLECIAYITCSL